MRTITKRHVCCPACDAVGSCIDHLVDAAARHGDAIKWGPWFCDGCHVAYSGRVEPDGTVVGDVVLGKRRIPGVATLVIPPQAGPITLRVAAAGYEPDNEREEGMRFYHEGTCPTNWLQRVVDVEVDGDTDPHGLAEFVSWEADP